jgi:cytochrome d ubiquinol oxidase subunit I
MQSEGLHAARVFMGDSLGFHIIFVLFGLTLPILVSWFEWMGIRKKDPKLIEVAKFWSKIMALLVITGVISGTVIALQMSLVWPGILKFGGDVIGLPFMFETYAFLIEAVFLALYMATWNSKKVSPTMHAIFGLFIVLGSTLSAYAITSINSWMNLPSGFTYINGKIENVSVVHAMFSQTSLVEFFHSMPAYYFAGALTVAGLYAVKILHAKRKDRLTNAYKLDWLIIKRLMVFSAVMFVALVITADITGKYLAKHEPVKLAAIEVVRETQTNVPLTLGGVATDDGRILGPYVQVPGALSFLSGDSTSTTVQGLADTDKSKQPPLFIHTFFDIKLTLIAVLIVILVVFIAAYKFKPKWLAKSWLLMSVSISGILAITVIELGWMMTEIGRQPWAVRGYVTTEDALTKTNDITTFGYLFPAAYLILFIVTIMAIRKIVKDDAKSNGVKK